MILIFVKVGHCDLVLSENYMMRAWMKFDVTEVHGRQDMRMTEKRACEY